MSLDLKRALGNNLLFPKTTFGKYYDNMSIIEDRDKILKINT